MFNKAPDYCLGCELWQANQNYNKCNFSVIKIIKREYPENARDSYTWGFEYKSKTYDSTISEPLTDERIIKFIEFMLDTMKKAVSN